MIHVLSGHASPKTTAIYTHVSTEMIGRTRSPLDGLAGGTPVIRGPRGEKRLPVALGRAKVARFFHAVASLKHRTVLMIAYGAGLRISEAHGESSAQGRIIDITAPGLAPLRSSAGPFCDARR